MFMKKTLYVLTCALCALLVLPAAAQVPSYVPTDGLVGSEGEEAATQGLVSRLRLDTFGGALTRSPPHQLAQLVREALEELGTRRDDTCVALVHVGAAGLS